MQETLAKAQELVVLYGMRIIATILILVVGYWISKLLSSLFAKLLKKSKIDDMICSFVKHISYFALFTFFIIAALNKLGIQTTSFVAVIGAAGLAIGFALQGSLSNFAAGVLIIIFKPFKTGDFVETGGTSGVIEEIQIFNTILRSPDNKRIIIPNSKVTGDNIINYTGIDKRRVDLVFGISYDDDIKKAKEILEKIVQEDKRILADPKPVIAVAELADSSVNIVCRPWVKPENYWNVLFDVTEKGKIKLEEGGICIPFPQRDVHLYEEKK